MATRGSSPSLGSASVREKRSGSGDASADARTGLLRGRGLAEQQALLAPVQRSGGGGGASAAIHEAALSGISGGGGALPHGEAIQASFGGHDVSGISAHVGGAAAAASDAMGARAYATGHSVAFKGAPDLHTAAHEAAHVVQQRAGVQLRGGVGQAGDSYEQNADAVADAVVAGRSAESLLGPVGPAGPGAGGVQRMAVQMESAGEPLFEGEILGIDVETEGASAELTTGAYRDANEEQKVAALGADHARWEARVIETESSLSEARAALEAVEAEVALSEYDMEAQAKLDALRARVREVEGEVEEAVQVEAIRRDQVAQVAGGTSVSDLTRVEGDPGITARGEAISTTKVEGSADQNGATASITDTQDGTEQKVSGTINYGEELSAEGSYSSGAAGGTDNTTYSGKGQFTDDGVILTGGVESRDGHEATETELSATIEADQVALGGRHSRGVDTTDVDGNGAKVMFNVAPGVGAQVEVKPVGEQYVLTGNVYFSIGIGGDASGQHTASAGGEHSTQVEGTLGASASLTGKASLAFEQPLTPEEAAAYAGDLTSSGDGETLPDYPWLASWKAAVGQALSGDLSASAMSDPTAAGGMRVGESYESSRETAWQWCIKGGVGVVSGSGGQSGKGSRSMKVARTAEGVALTLAFGTEATVKADGSVTFEGITVGLGASGKDTYGASTTFLLDPASAEFDRQFGEVEAQLSMATSVDELHAASSQFEGLVSAFTEATGSEDSVVMTIGVGDAGEIAITDTVERGMAYDETGATATGGRGTSGDLKVAGTDVLHAEIKETGEFKADEDGISTDLRREQSSTALGLEASEWTPSALWASLTGGGVKGALAERLTVARTSINRLSVSPENMRVLLTERVNDESNWHRCQVTVSNWEAWDVLRARLLNPHPSSNDVGQYGEELATLIDHCDGLAEFMTCRDSYDTLESALNHWGEDNGGFFGTGGQRSDDTRDLALYIEWPSSISEEDPKYDKALADAAGARDAFTAISAAPDAAEQVGTRSHAIIAELVRIKLVIEEHASDFSDSRSRLEMVESLDGGVLQVREAREEALVAIDGGYDMSEVSVEFDDSAIETRRLDDAAARLRDYKSSEATLFERMQQGLASYQDDQHEGEWFAGVWAAGDRLVAEDWRPVTSEYQTLVEQWIRKVKELRGLYQSNDLSSDQWKVSARAGEARNHDYEPDIPAYQSILRAILDEQTFWDLSNDSALKTWLRNNADY